MWLTTALQQLVVIIWQKFNWYIKHNIYNINVKLNILFLNSLNIIFTIEEGVHGFISVNIYILSETTYHNVILKLKYKLSASLAHTRSSFAQCSFDMLFFIVRYINVRTYSSFQFSFVMLTENALEWTIFHGETFATAQGECGARVVYTNCTF